MPVALLKCCTFSYAVYSLVVFMLCRVSLLPSFSHLVFGFTFVLRNCVFQIRVLNNLRFRPEYAVNLDDFLFYRYTDDG